MSDDVALSAPMTPRAAKRRRLDIALSIIIWVLVLAVLGLGGLFGYTIYASRLAESYSTPGQRAMRDLEALVKKNPNNADARVRLGEAYATAKMNDAAVSNLQVAIKLNPKHTGAFFDLGLLMMSENQPKVAQQYFQKVLELTAGQEFTGIDERREAALFYLGQIAAGDSRWNDAVGYLKAAVRIKGDSSDTYYLLALAYEGLKDPQNAAKNLGIALAFDPKYPSAHYELGRIYEAAGREASAAVEFRTALDNNPAGTQAQDELNKFGSASSHTARAAASLKLGKLADAEQQGLEAVSIDPANIPAQLLLASIFEKERDKANALTRYKRVIELDPKNAEALQGVKRLGGK